MGVAMWDLVPMEFSKFNGGIRDRGGGRGRANTSKVALFMICRHYISRRLLPGFCRPQPST